MLTKIALGCVLFASAALAQQTEWQQCGGIGWTGGTSCAQGLVCTELNSYYFQCLAATTTTAKTSTTSTTSTSSTSKTTSTSTTKTTTSTTGTKPTSTPNFWFSFGDSYTQTDFETNGTLPAIGNPLGNPPYPGYTAVGGTNWIDVDTVVYNKSLILTWNYAYGGATIDASLVTPYEPTVLSMTDQVNQFLSGAALKPSTAPWTSQNALFSFWIGINDIGNSYGSQANPDEFNDTLLNAYFALVEKILNVGGRNFLFINVPPIDRSPLMLAEPASAQAAEKSMIADYNTKLATRAAQLAQNNTGVTTWLWDSNTAFTTVLNNPTAYGFVDAVSYGNTGDFWGNNYHSSSAAQTIWGQGVAAVLANTVW